jgi:hypothetical protein
LDYRHYLAGIRTTVAVVRAVCVRRPAIANVAAVGARRPDVTSVRARRSAITSIGAPVDARKANAGLWIAVKAAKVAGQLRPATSRADGQKKHQGLWYSGVHRRYSCFG